MKTPEVIEALKARHAEERGWVWLVEAHRIDFLALACHGEYSDRRRERQERDATHPWVGYEVKVSRGDFLHEIKRPDKRAFAVSRCHEFYFAAPSGLIKPEEVPADCGLVEVHATGTTCRVKAPIRSPEPMSHLHLSQMFRHGMRPAFVRYFEERIRDERWKRRAAAMDAGRAEDRAKVAEEVLAEMVGPLIEVGSSWTARGVNPRRAEKCTVVEVGERSVKLAFPGFNFCPRYAFGEFLLAYAPTERSERIAA